MELHPTVLDPDGWLVQLRLTSQKERNNGISNELDNDRWIGLKTSFSCGGEVFAVDSSLSMGGLKTSFSCGGEVFAVDSSLSMGDPPQHPSPYSPDMTREGEPKGDAERGNHP